MKSIELATEIVDSNPEQAKRLDALASKVEEVIAEVARASGSTTDEVLNALMQRQQATQARRGQARVAAELAVLNENADRIAKETERLLTEGG